MKNQKKTVGDLRQQLNEKNIEIQELKRLKDLADNATDRAVSDNALLKSRMEEKARTIQELQNKLTDRVAREKRRDSIAKFIHAGTQIFYMCGKGLTDSPQKEFREWHDQIMSFFTNSNDSSYVIRFTDTIPGDAKLHYFIDGKSVRNGCTDTALIIDRKLNVLREILSELSK